jgi:DNA-binding YbaB/EbfC family protein
VDASKMQEMLAQAGQMQEQMHERLTQTVTEATSGGGVVTVKMNGEKQVLSLKINPSAVAGLGANAADVEMLEDLIIAALNEAGRKIDDLAKASLSGMLGGLDLPAGLLG